MQFILNNLLFVLVSLFVVTFAVIIVIKIAKEISLNRLLRDKHSAMRINIDQGNTGFKKRIGFLTSTALAPMAVVALVIAVGMNADNLSSGDQNNITSSDEIINIYDDYNNLLGDNYVIRDREYDFEDNSEAGEVVDMPKFDYIVSPEYRVISTTNITGTDDIDEDIQTEMALYQIDDFNMNLVVSSSSDETDFPISQMITYNSNVSQSTECRKEEYINGFYVTESTLLVVTSEYSVGCLYQYEGYTSEEEYVLSTTDVHVYQYDNPSNPELSTIYTFDGILVGTSFGDGELLVITDSYIPYEKDGFVLDLHLPNYAVDISGNKRTFGVPLVEILYVDGVLPNTFISLYQIDIENKDVTSETLLLDDAFNIVVTEDKVTITTNIYYFEQASLVFDLADPIDELSQITFTYDLTDGLVFQDYKIE